MNEGRDPFVSSLASHLNMRLTRLAEEREIPLERLLDKSVELLLEYMEDNELINDHVKLNNVEVFLSFYISEHYSPSTSCPNKKAATRTAPVEQLFYSCFILLVINKNDACFFCIFYIHNVFQETILYSGHCSQNIFLHNNNLSAY